MALFPEDRKTGYHRWAFRRLLDSPGRPGFLLLLGPGPFLPPAPRALAQAGLMLDPDYFGGELDRSACPSSAAAEFDHAPSSWMTLLVRRHFLFIKLDCI